MFELHITCTKDIEKLSIDFSDGTSIVQEKEPKKKPKEKSIETESNDFDNFKPYTPKKEVVKPIDLPEIIDRPAKIDNILDNLEI